MKSPADPPRRNTGNRRLSLVLLGIAMAPVPLVSLLSAGADQPASRLTVTAIGKAPDRPAGSPAGKASDSPRPTESGFRTSGMQGHPAETDTEAKTAATDARKIPAGNVSGIPRAALGVWEDDYQGHRTLTLRGDGTGTMVIELDGVAASLFAAKLRFEQTWSFDAEEQLITMAATGGEPQGKVNLILRIYGRQATYRITDVTDELLVLVDQADGKRYEWRRVEEVQP